MTGSFELSPAEIASYRDHGFVLLGRVLDDSTLAALQGEEARFRARPQISLADYKTVMPDTSTVFRNQLASYSAVVRRVFLDGDHIEAVAQLIGPLVCARFNQFVTKLPDANRATAEFPWHQDNGYGNKHSSGHVTVWCALDDVDEVNGCVWVIPGSHREGLLPHNETGTSWHVAVQTLETGIPVLLRAGEAVAFTGFTLHRSLTNGTDKPRRAFFMGYSDYVSDLVGEPVINPAPLWIARGELPYPDIGG